MANTALRLASVGTSRRDIFIVEGVLKKFFPPKKFQLAETWIPPAYRVRTEESIAATVGATKALPHFSDLETDALCALQLLPEKDAVVVFNYGPNIMGPFVASHLSVRALFMDAQRSEDEPWKYGDAIPFVSEVVMPYLGTAGATDEQLARGKKTVLRNAIEGWKVWSERHGGLATRL